MFLKKYKMERKNFHETGYGWNYFFDVAKNGAIRVGRYWTNGAININEQTTRWGVTKKAPESGIDCDRIFSDNQQL